MALFQSINMIFKNTKHDMKKTTKYIFVKGTLNPNP